MKAIQLSSVSGVFASVVIISAATLRTFADKNNTGSPTNTSCCEQTVAAAQICMDCNRAFAAPDLEGCLNTAALAETARLTKSRHTVTAFGSIISRNKDAEKTEWRERDAAAFAETQLSGSWSRGDAERQPQGLRLFSWSW